MAVRMCKLFLLFHILGLARVVIQPEPGQRKLKFNYAGIPGSSVDFIMRHKGDKLVTIKSVKAEACAEPVELKYCPNPWTDMQVPYLKLTAKSTIPTLTTPWQAIIGSGSNYTLPDNVTYETITATLFCMDEPRIEEVSLYGENIGKISLWIYRRNRAKIFELFYPKRFMIDGWTYIYFDQLGEQSGDKLALHITKADLTRRTVISGLNIVACYTPDVMCPREFVIDRLNIKSNHTGYGADFEEYTDNPHKNPLDIVLFNHGQPTVVKAYLKEDEEPPIAFYNIKLTVTDAALVKLALKFNNGTVVETLKNLIASHQTTLFENFYGAVADYLEIEITPKPGHVNATMSLDINQLRCVIIDACTHKYPDYCKLRTRTELIKLDNCQSSSLVTFNYCQGKCLPSEFIPTLHFNVKEDDPSKLSDKDCKCCTGTPKVEKTSIPMKCVGEPDKTVYIQEYADCQCHSCVT